jgi:hypothetical protein
MSAMDHAFNLTGNLVVNEVSTILNLQSMILNDLLFDLLNEKTTYEPISD